MAQLRFVQERYSKADDEDSDQWTSGKVMASDGEVEEEMASFLESNTSFLINMTKTGAFSVPSHLQACLTFV